MTITPEELERLEIMANNIDFLAHDVCHDMAKGLNTLIATIRKQWAEIERLRACMARLVNKKHPLPFKELEELEAMVDELVKGDK